MTVPGIFCELYNDDINISCNVVRYTVSLVEISDHVLVLCWKISWQSPNLVGNSHDRVETHCGIATRLRPIRNGSSHCILETLLY